MHNEFISRESTVPIRVLLIAPSMRIMGGQAVQAARLMKNLRESSSISIDFLPIAPTLPRFLAFIQSIKFLRTVTTFLYYLPGVLLRVPRYQVVHIFCASYWSYALWSLPPLFVGKLFGKKVILNYRSGEAEDHLTTWRIAIPTLKLSDHIVAPGDYLVDVFAKFGLQAKSINNILDPADFTFRQRKKLRPVFLSNRGLEPIYNVECIIRAFKIIQEQHPTARLIIAHDGSCRETLIALSTELRLENVSFVGRVEQQDMAKLYDAVDVYLTSPNLDCMPNSLLECFASGVPFVATKAGGIPYIVRHNETGLLVNCNDHEAMGAFCLRLLKDEALVERLTKAAKAELFKYTANTVCDQWIKLYTSS